MNKVGIIGEIKKVKDYLESNNFECIEEKDIFKLETDMIVVDGEINGIVDDVERFKEYNRNIPVLVILKRKDHAKIINFLEKGADEVIDGTNPAVVFAYVKAILKKMGRWKERIIRSSDGKIEIDISNSEVIIGKKKMILPPKEMELLTLLLNYRNQLLTREFILNTVWGSAEITTHTLEVHINRLRKKLGKVGNRIVSIPRRGYKFND